MINVLLNCFFKYLFQRKHLCTILFVLSLLLTRSFVNGQQWERVSLFTQANKDFFAAKVGNPSFPEASNFVGGEGAQWPQAWAVSGDGKVLLWGTDVGGIARSIDAGASWIPVNFGFNARGGVGFAIDPMNPDRAIAVGGNGGRDWVGAHGIYVTSNLKSEMPSWTQKLSVNITGYRDIREQVTYDLSSYDAALGYCKIAYWTRGYFDSYEDITKHCAIHKTTDGGETWTELFLDNAEYNRSVVKTHPTLGYVYLSNQNGFYKSTDGASSFVKKFTKDITGMDVVTSAGNADKVFLSSPDGVYISNDAGETFSKVSSNNYPQTTGTYMPASFVKVSPADAKKMMLQIQTDQNATPKFYTIDGGVNWIKCVENTDNLSYLPFLSGRIGYSLWHPTDANRCWAFGSDFMQTSFDGAQHFRWAHNGLPAVMAREFNFSTTTPNVFVIPTQDYDVSVTKDNGQTWKYLDLSKNGWGGYFYGAYSSNGDVVFGIEKNSSDFSHYQIAITWDGGTTTTKFLDDNMRINGFHVAMGDPHDSKIFFAGEFRSSDEGHSWQKMNGCNGVFIASPTGNRELYGVSGLRTIVRSVDRGVTWMPVGEIPNDVSDIAIDHLTGRIYAATTWNLYQLDIANGNVTDITSRVPADQYNNRRFYQVAVDPVNPNVIYCAGASHIYANDAAVKRSVDGGVTWEALTRSPRLNNPQFGIDGGKEGEIVRVNPWTREALIGTNCYGTWKIGAPVSSLDPNALADLIVSDIQWTPVDAKAGDDVTITAVVRNVGTSVVNSGDNFTVQFNIDGATFSTVANSIQIGVNQSVQLAGHFTATEGNHVVKALVDNTNIVSEKSEENNQQSALMLIKTAVAPQSPTDLTVTSKSTTTLNVEWTPAAGSAVGYRLYINNVYTGYVTGTSYTFANLIRYTEYAIVVKAVDATGNESEGASLTTFTDARGAANTAAKTATPMVIDGSLNEVEWNLQFKMDKGLDGTSNNTASYGMLWDDDNVYIGIKILDNTLVSNNSTNDQNDGIQLFINGNRESDASADQWYWYNDIIGGKVLNNDVSLYELWNWDNNHMNLDDVTHKTKIIPGGYTMEFSIPWGRGDQYKGIGWETGVVGKRIGVDVWNLDNDGNGRQSITNWNGNWDNQWKGGNLGDVVLGPLGGDTEVPTVVTDISATPSPTKVALTWNSSSDNSHVAEYFIYANGKRIAELNATSDASMSYTAAGLQQNTLYRFTIKAVDDAGNVSGFSEDKNVTTLLDNNAPSTPKDLVISDLNSTNVTLSWTASTDDFGVKNYHIIQDNKVVTTTDKTTIRITGLKELTSYNFSVNAEDEVGNVSVASGIVTVATPDHKLATAFAISEVLTIDGLLNETAWTDAESNDVQHSIEGTTDNVVKFKTAWDQQNLYVAVQVKDPTLKANAGQFWSTDAIEVYVDPNNSRKDGYDGDDRQFTRVINALGTYGSGSQSGVTHAWSSDGDVYVLEMSIPWSNLAVTPTAQSTFGFDIGNNDDDSGNGRSGVLMWNGNGDNWHNTSIFGKLQLLGLDTGRIVVSSICSAVPANTRGWKITSTYETDKKLIWSVNGTSQTGDVVIPSEGKLYFETVAAGDNKLLITYGNGKTATGVSTGSICNINLTSMCSDNPRTTRRWRVANPLAKEIQFTWKVDGTNQTGSGKVAPDDVVYFETQTVSGANTTIIEGNDAKVTKASGGQPCDPNLVMSVQREGDVRTILYPNPAANTVIISSSEKMRRITMSDVTGNEVARIESLNETEITLDVTKLAHGSFIVKVLHASGNVHALKLIITR